MKFAYIFLKKSYFLLYALFSMLKPSSDRQARCILLDIRDMHMQRRLYYLCFYLQKAGFRTKIAMSPQAIMNLNKYGIKAFSLPNTVLSLSRNTSHDLLIYHGFEPNKNTGISSMELSVDVFSLLRKNEVGEKDLFFPIAFHPYNLNRSTPEVLEKLQRTEKKIGLFFAGNIDASKYNNEKTGILFKILNRWEVVHTVLNAPELSERIVRPKSYSHLCELMASTTIRNKIVICDTHTAPVPKDEWMETLSKSRYFLAPPGVIQPYCHNLVEAMGVGTIPITQLAEYYRPVLRDRKNSLCFKNSNQLIAKIVEALDETVPENENHMSNSAIDYYEHHFSPWSFQRKMNSYIEAGSTVGKLILSHNKESVRLFEMYMDADPHE